LYVAILVRSEIAVVRYGAGEGDRRDEMLNRWMVVGMQFVMHADAGKKSYETGSNTQHDRPTLMDDTWLIRIFMHVNHH
jgi:hypothetical protein